MNTAINTALALLLALVLGTAHLLDGPDDMRAEWDQSQAIKDLHASQDRTARREVAAQALCSQERGPNSEARFTLDGNLVCTTRRGVRALAVAGAKL